MRRASLHRRNRSIFNIFQYVKKIGECRVNLHNTLPEVEIPNRFPLYGPKREQTGTLCFILSKSEYMSPSIVNPNRTMLFDSTNNNANIHMQTNSSQMSQQMLVPHLGRIDKSYDFSGNDPSFECEDERTQLQIIQQELTEQGLCFLMLLGY